MIGYKFFTIDSFVWREYKNFILPLTPFPSSKSDLSLSSIKNMLSASNAYFVRWESEPVFAENNAWWHVIQDKPVALSDLTSNTRNQVRKGFNYFYLSSLSINDVINEGYDVYLDAFNRYNTHESKFTLKQFTDAVSSLHPSTDFWGVREHNTHKLVGFSENFVQNNVCLFNSMWFSPGYLKSYSAYVLIFSMLQVYLVERGFDFVSNGSRSLSHATNIHSMLINKFRFKKKYLKLNILYKPKIKIFINALYPFRSLIFKINLKYFNMASSLLRQEEIRRICC